MHPFLFLRSNELSRHACMDIWRLPRGSSQEVDLKMKADVLFKDLGTDTTTAIRKFLTQAVMRNGIPFEIMRVSEVSDNPYRPFSEKELLSRLDTARKHAAQGKYRDAEDAVADMRAKYGL